MPTILAVDDEHAILNAYEAALHHAGYTVYTAVSSAHALQCLDQRRPDLVLLDIDLGAAEEGDGIDLLRQMRDRMPDVRVVMVSAYLDLVTQHIAREAGAVDCWPKPISLPVLVERTAAVLNDVGACSA